MIGLHWLLSTFAGLFFTKTSISGLGECACEGSLRSSGQTDHSPDKRCRERDCGSGAGSKLQHVMNKGAMFYLCSGLVLILQFRECLRFSECSVADLRLGNCTTGRKVEARVVFGELHRSDTGLATQGPPDPVLLSWIPFCETCSLVTILAGVGDAILTIKTPRFSNQTTWLLSRGWNWSDISINPLASKNKHNFTISSIFLSILFKWFNWTMTFFLLSITIRRVLNPRINHLTRFLDVRNWRLCCSGGFTSKRCCHLVDVICVFCQSTISRPSAEAESEVFDILLWTLNLILGITSWQRPRFLVNVKFQLHKQLKSVLIAGEAPGHFQSVVLGLEHL